MNKIRIVKWVYCVYKCSMPHTDEQWIQKGVDIWQIRENLKLSYEERASQHQYMLNLIEELNQIGLKNRERSSGSSQITDS